MSGTPPPDGSPTQPVTSLQPNSHPLTHKQRLMWLTLASATVFFLLLLSFVPAALSRSPERGEDRYIELFVDVLRHVKDFYIDEEKTKTRSLMEGALKGMIRSLDDPYSAYLTADEMQLLEETTSGQFGGIGVVIAETERGIEVSRPLRGTPAYKAGMLPGDLIVGVDGESIVELSLDETVNLIRGEAGTEVRLTILREGGSEWDVTLVRDYIETSSVEEAMIKGGIAYLQIASFSMATTQQVQDALDFFQDAEYRGLIVDLRGNPGGLLSTVVEIADLFFDKGTIVVSTKSRVLALNRVYRAETDAAIPASLPIIVIIDRYSASASEILAGALKDHDRAILVGENSFGKGTVQEILPKADGGVKLTSSYYLTPSGQSIAEVGVSPDVEAMVPELAQEEKESYRVLVESSRMEGFLARIPEPGEGDVQAFLRSLVDEGFAVPENLVRQYLKDLLNRRNRIYPIYDLEYDTVLQRAVALLRDMIDR